MAAASCASTTMSSFSDPQFAGRTYSNVLVHVAVDDLALRRQIEGRITENLTDAGVVGTCSIDVFFPGREYSPDEVGAALQPRGVDAVLVLAARGGGYTSQYIPPTYHTTSRASGTSTTSGYATGSAYRSGNYVQGSAYGTSVTRSNAVGTSTTSVSGGHNVHKPWAQFRAELVDCRAGAVVWTGQGDSRGNAFNDFEDLWQSVADEAVDELQSAGRLRSAAAEACDSEP